MRYIQELEHKVQVLQTEATTLSAQLTMLQVKMFCGAIGDFDSSYKSNVNFDNLRYPSSVERFNWTGHSKQ